MARVLLINVKDNPYRDRVRFPTSETKKAEIRESIQQTDFWDNLLVRVRNNELADGTVIKDAAHLAELLETGALDFGNEEFELAYGHHRIDVLRELDWTEMEVPVKYITDEKMMRIMANENKEGWGSGIHSILETVRQVYGVLEDQLADYSGYNDYVDTLGDKAIFTKKQFNDAKTQGIGYRTIQAFLGDSWSQASVRVPMSVLNAIQKKYFTQEQIMDIPSLGLLDALTACIVAMYEGGKVSEKVEVPKKDKDGNPIEKDGKPVMVKETKFVTKPGPDWPMYFKDKMVKELIQQCLPSEVKDSDRGDEGAEFLAEITLTQHALNKRRVSMLKNGSAPTTNGTKAFRVGQAIRREFFPAFDSQCPNEEREKLYENLTTKDMAAFKATPGIAGWAGLDKMVESLLTSFEVLLSPLEDDEQLQSDLQSDLEENANSSEEFDSKYQDLEIEMEVEDEETGEKALVPMGQISADTIQILSVSHPALDLMLSRVEEIDLETDVTLGAAIRETVTRLGMLYGKAASIEDVHGLFADVLETLKAE
jgi:hypothetical protein